LAYALHLGRRPECLLGLLSACTDSPVGRRERRAGSLDRPELVRRPLRTLVARHREPYHRPAYGGSKSWLARAGGEYAERRAAAERQVSTWEWWTRPGRTIEPLYPQRHGWPVGKRLSKSPKRPTLQNTAYGLDAENRVVVEREYIYQGRGLASDYDNTDLAKALRRALGASRYAALERKRWVP
jgi:hypothetical protein